MADDSHRAEPASAGARPEIPLDGLDSLRALFVDRPDLFTAVAGDETVDQHERARALFARRRIGRVWGALHRR
jgi:hypothetical protein